MTFTDPTAPTAPPIDEIVCACAQVFGPHPADGTYTARIMIDGENTDVPGCETEADAWARAAVFLARASEFALAALCEQRSGKPARSAHAIRLPDGVERLDGDEWQVRPGIPAPVLPRAGDDPARFWTDGPAGLSEWENHEMRRAFDDADRSLRYIATAAAELLHALHTPERGSSLRFRMATPFGQRMAEFYAAIARLDAIGDVVAHRQVLARKYGAPPAETDT